jgi:hypothetical protein
LTAPRDEQPSETVVTEAQALERTRRDSDGRVVATGICNELNDAPGEKVVIEIILMSAKGCRRESVRLDGLTG